MPALRVTLPHPAFDALRRELEVPEAFPVEVLAEADAAAAQRHDLPDRTDLPMLTVDPLGSTDLDQALLVEPDGDGWVFWYAIADVASFVRPGGPLDAETLRRGQTLYAPDLRVPLHPPVLGEGAASLLADQVRPAVLWRLALDAAGEPTDVQVARALVRSRRQLAYDGAQRLLDDGDPQLQAVRALGLLRQERAAERGAVDLAVPEQEVRVGPDGQPVLSLRAGLPLEAWNAQLSLLTGTAAAGLMLEGGVGLLRTLPPPDPEAVASLRRSALALGVAWPEGASYAEVVSGLDGRVAVDAALLVLATRLLRGSGYTAFDGQPPEQGGHSAVAAPYAHATAPLRRLADRHVLETCLALAAGRPVPDWVRAALPGLPAAMSASGRRASALERAGVDLAEALVLAPRVGEAFTAVVVEAGERKGVVQLRDPVVRAACTGEGLPLGGEVQVELVEADPVRRTVQFRLTAG